MLNQIPTEILIYHIIPKLDLNDCYNLSHCCKYLYDRINNNNLCSYLHTLPIVTKLYEKLSPQEFLDNKIIKKVKFENILEKGRYINLITDICLFGTINLLTKGKIYYIDNNIHIYGPILIEIKTNGNIFTLKANFKVINLFKQELYGDYNIQIKESKIKSIFTSLETYMGNNKNTIICILYSPLSEKYSINLVKDNNKYVYSYFFIYNGINLYDINPFFHINNIKCENDWNVKIKLFEKELFSESEHFDASHLIFYNKGNYEYSYYIYHNKRYIFKYKDNYLFYKVKPNDKYNYLFNV